MSINENNGRWWKSAMLGGGAGALVGALATLLGQRMNTEAAAQLKGVELRFGEAARAYAAVLANLDRISYVEIEVDETITEPKARQLAFDLQREHLAKAHDSLLLAQKSLGPYLNQSWREWLQSRIFEWEELSPLPILDLEGRLLTPTPSPPGGPPRDREVVLAEIESGLLFVLFDWKNEKEFPPTPAPGTVATPVPSRLKEPPRKD